MRSQFIKLAEGFYLNLDTITQINGNEVVFTDGSTFALDEECLEALTKYLNENHV